MSESCNIYVIHEWGVSLYNENINQRWKNGRVYNSTE